MRIVVNTRLLIRNKLDGIGWFTYETLKRITKKRADDEFIFVFDRPYSKEFLFGDNVVPFQIGPPARHPFLWWIWFENSIPRILNRFQPDLFLSPDGHLSMKTMIPSLPVIHDINFEHFPKDLPWAYRTYYRSYFPKFAKKATRIATVSKFSKNDIANSYGVDPNKIDVVYNGYNELYKPTSTDESNAIRKELTNGAPYFLFIGSLHPRKNIRRLLEAFDKFKSETSSETRLVIIGEKKWWNRETEKTFRSMHHRGHVVFTGRVLPEQLSKVIGGALAMAYVSAFEGFGIPILEGMAAGVPVITSESSSMPEVAGEAALLVNPLEVDSIANGLSQLDSDRELRKNLAEKGLKRAGQFSWERTADLLWKSIEKTVHAG